MYKHGLAGYVKVTEAKMQFLTSFFTLMRLLSLNVAAVTCVTNQSGPRFGHILC